MLGVLSSLTTPETAVISDEFNHNSIINAMRLARPAKRQIYPHLDLSALEACLAGQVEAREAQDRHEVKREAKDTEYLNTRAYLGGALLRRAKYDSFTKWPDGFDPEKAGAIRVDNEEVDPKETKSPQPREDENASR